MKLRVMNTRTFSSQQEKLLKFLFLKVEAKRLFYTRKKRENIKRREKKIWLKVKKEMRTFIKGQYHYILKHFDRCLYNKYMNYVYIFE